MLIVFVLQHVVDLERGKAGFKSDNYLRFTDYADRPFLNI
jgi:hypothetical protein